ncbi:hypothetical protein F5I97DRAFT_1815278 [Phlebopus sp. FC_14]|nr:hypothetical protein F5I97DRAFT_1815278 [Phlebopus sp. FC_14]
MTTPLQAFFAKYPPFIYDPSKSASKEFYRLCEYFNWRRRDNVDRTTAHEAFKTALVKQFNVVYGTDEESLSAWRKLCEAVNVHPIPVRMADCRQAVRNVHVNLVDLVDREFTGAKIQIFTSEAELNEYTRKNGKFFPRYNVHAGSLLRALLRRRREGPRSDRRPCTPSSQRTNSDSDSDSDPATHLGPLPAYFSQFAANGFTFAPTHGAQANFKRLCRTLRWDSPERQRARSGFHDALVQQFNAMYGTDGSDLGAWQNLCAVIGAEPVPEGLEACRRVVWDAHVNIVDLVDTARTGKPVRIFNSLDELARYTKRTDMFFPKENAYQGGLLKELLREIINPYYGKRRNGSQKRKLRKARKRAAQAANGS